MLSQLLDGAGEDTVVVHITRRARRPLLPCVTAATVDSYAGTACRIRATRASAYGRTVNRSDAEKPSEEGPSLRAALFSCVRSGGNVGLDHTAVFADRTSGLALYFRSRNSSRSGSARSRISRTRSTRCAWHKVAPARASSLWGCVCGRVWSLIHLECARVT
jgi:hypothetical protein